MLNENLIESYKHIYKQRTGKELNDEEAFSQMMKLVTLVKAVYKNKYNKE